MRARDPFELPIRKLAKTINLQKHCTSIMGLLLDRFLVLSAHEKELMNFVSSHYPLNLEYSEVVDKALDSFSYSLDEAESVNHLTPYHLSFLVPYFSAIKAKGQFFTPSYLADYLASQIIDLYIHSFDNNDEKSKETNLHTLTFADIACGTGNLLIALLTHLRYFF
ncbi:MAG: hypothetical protein ACTSX6_11405, partial [Candidatus Heimdallarchaeaceae archaeon]